MPINIARFTGKNITLPDTGGYSTPEDAQIKKIDVIKDSLSNGIETEEYDFDDEEIDASFDISTLSEEDLQLLIGSLSQDEYDELIEGVQNNYDSENEVLQQMLDGIKELKDCREYIYSNYARPGSPGADEYYTNPAYNSTVATRVQDYLTKIDSYIEEGYVKEGFADLEYLEQVEILKEVDPIVKSEFNNYNDKMEMINGDIQEILAGTGITSYDELIQLIESLEPTESNIKNAIQANENAKASAPYDYLIYLEDYDNYSVFFDDSLNNTFEDDSNINITINGNGQLIASGSYDEYSKMHPEVTPIEYLKMLVNNYGTADIYNIKAEEEGIKSEDWYDILTIINVSEYYPDLEKTYNYLYEINPDYANSFLEDCKYEINDFEGQLRANEFLSILYKDDGDSNLLEAAANELGVTTEGLADGINNFESGVYYSFEAFATALGICEENRIMSAEEYKKMYILYALLSTKAKESNGFITKDDDGNYVNTDANSIIDYTINYSGAFLSNNFEISQGFGNMIPSVAISTFCPIAGSISMGLSAGGNSYHDSMVNGHSLLSSILYGIFDGAGDATLEWLIGGIPKLSKVNVIDVKSYLRAVGGQAFDGGLSVFTDRLARAIILDEPLPETKDEWIELLKSARKQVAYGAITAGIMQSSTLILSLKARKALINSFNERCIAEGLTESQYLTFIQSHEGEGLTEYQIIEKYGDQFITDTVSSRNETQQRTAAENSLIIEEFNSKVNELVEQGIKEEYAKIMVENDVDYNIAKLVVDNQVTFEQAKIMADYLIEFSNDCVNKGITETEYLAFLESHEGEGLTEYQIVEKYGDQFITDTESARNNTQNISTTDDSLSIESKIDKYVQQGIEREYAEIMAEHEVDYETAKLVMDEKIPVDTAKIMIEYELSSDVAFSAYEFSKKNNLSTDITGFCFKKSIDFFGDSSVAEFLLTHQSLESSNVPTGVSKSSINAFFDSMSSSDVYKLISGLDETSWIVHKDWGYGLITPENAKEYVRLEYSENSGKYSINLTWPEGGGYKIETLKPVSNLSGEIEITRIGSKSGTAFGIGRMDENGNMTFDSDGSYATAEQRAIPKTLEQSSGRVEKINMDTYKSTIDILDSSLSDDGKIKRLCSTLGISEKMGTDILNNYKKNLKNPEISGDNSISKTLSNSGRNVDGKYGYYGEAAEAFGLSGGSGQLNLLLSEQVLIDCGIISVIEESYNFG